MVANLHGRVRQRGAARRGPPELHGCAAATRRSAAARGSFSLTPPPKLSTVCAPI